MSDVTDSEPFPVVDSRVVRRKVSLRIVPLVFLLYVVAYLDRANAGFVKAPMQQALGFTDQQFGWAFGIFFVGYLLLEIPGALMVEHRSASWWFTRIMITWGICSMATALVREAWQFYLARFLLGLAEAGFFPGIIVYFTHWYPRAQRARALAGMVLGIPVSLALGARISGWLLKAGWFGLAGWQWVFLIEGLPAVLLGLSLPFLLTDRPRHARWLTRAERNWLEDTLAAERQTGVQNAPSLAQVLRQPIVWLLALGIFATNTGGYALVFWLPTAMQHLVPEAQVQSHSEVILNWVGLIYACGLAGVWLSGHSSDRSGERKWHCVAGQVLTGLCLMASVVPGQPWALVLTWLCLVGFFAFAWPAPFWVLPTLSLSASTAAVAIGFINICANLAGAFGSPVVGWMKDGGFDDRACLVFLASCYLAGALFVACLRLPHGNPKYEIRNSKETPISND
jgi:ACS family tartrate transporter-like MFS transporter